jgi:hypothetical protein
MMRDIRPLFSMKPLGGMTRFFKSRENENVEIESNTSLDELPTNTKSIFTNWKRAVSKTIFD